jgi:hypothetical protein
MMKAIVAVALALAIGGCCENSAIDPAPPYGTPDKIDRTEGDNGFVRITYTYHCVEALGNIAVTISYVRPDECSEFVTERETRGQSGNCGD